MSNELTFHDIQKILAEVYKPSRSLRPIFAELMGNSLSVGMYLSQAHYWMGKGSLEDGWIYKTCEEFQSEIYLSRRQQDKAREELRKKDWWQEKVARVGATPKFQFRIEQELLDRDIIDFILKRRESMDKSDLPTAIKSDLPTAIKSDLPTAIAYTKTTSSKTTKTEITNTHNPDARAEKSFGENFGRGENAGVPPVNPSPPIPLGGTPSELTIDESLVQPEPITQSLEVFPISGEERSSAATTSTSHQGIQKFNDSFNYSNDIGSLTAELVRTYNNGKPDRWTGVVGESGAVRRKIKGLWDRYQLEGKTIEQLVEDWKNALLWYRSSDFHTGEKFGSGNIFWLSEGERIEIAAANWVGASEAVVKKVAVGIAQQQEGIRRWEDGVLVTGINLILYRGKLEALMRKDISGRPPDSYYLENFPKLLELKPVVLC